MKLFNELLKCIDSFVPDDPMIKEADLEATLKKFLKECGFSVTQQVAKNRDRYDLIIRSVNEIVCIELKLKTGMSDIDQFDKYLPQFKDGFIVMCWQASMPLLDIFENVEKQSPTPVKIIQLCERYNLV